MLLKLVDTIFICAKLIVPTQRMNDVNFYYIFHLIFLFISFILVTSSGVIQFFISFYSFILDFDGLIANAATHCL